MHILPLSALPKVNDKGLFWRPTEYKHWQVEVRSSHIISKKYLRTITDTKSI